MLYDKDDRVPRVEWLRPGSRAAIPKIDGLKTSMPIAGRRCPGESVMP